MKLDSVYRTLTLQGAPRELREYLCSSTQTYPGYHDVDIVNCFLVIACWLAEKYNQDVPSLRSYCANDVSRKQYLDDIVEAHALIDRFGPSEAREVAKNLPITLLHGGTYDGWMHRHDLPFKEHEQKQIKAVVEMGNELVQLCKNMAKAKDGFEKDIFAQRLLFKKRTGRSATTTHKNSISPLDRSLLGYVLQTYEAHVLDVIERFATSEGWVVGSLQFDGLYIEHREGFCLQDLIQGAQEEVIKATQSDTVKGLAIQLKEKTLHDSQRSDVILDNWERTFKGVICEPSDWQY